MPSKAKMRQLRAKRINHQLLLRKQHLSTRPRNRTQTLTPPQTQRTKHPIPSPSSPFLKKQKPSSSLPEADPAGQAEAAAAAREAALQTARMNRFTPSQLEAMDEAEKQRQRDDYRRRYNAAARWWLKIMVGLPVFIVSSWHLFDRREFTLTFVSRTRIFDLFAHFCCCSRLGECASGCALASASAWDVASSEGRGTRVVIDYPNAASTSSGRLSLSVPASSSGQRAATET